MNHASQPAARTVGELLETGAAEIGESSDSPELDARLLLQAVLGHDHAWLITHNTAPVDADDTKRFHEWIRRRARSEPVAYIIERKAFWTIELKVTRDVLVPRPETELLVEHALDRVPLSESVSVLDLGTGSGAVGLAVAAERPLCKVTATDASQTALRIAEQNKGRLGLRNIDFRHGDWYDAIGNDRFAVIACNPPYIADSHYAAALSYEPRDALLSGSRGLDALETVIEGAAAHLEPGGWLLVEHGYDQETAVQDLFNQAGLETTTTHRDNTGHPRVTGGRRPRG